MLVQNAILVPFKLFLATFLLGGTALVLGQLLGLLIQDSEVVIKSRELFSYPTYISSAVTGILGFILGYFPKADVCSGGGEE